MSDEPRETDAVVSFFGRKNADAAVDVWIETAKQDGIPIPEPLDRLMFP